MTNLPNDLASRKNNTASKVVQIPSSGTDSSSDKKKVSNISVASVTTHSTTIRDNQVGLKKSGSPIHSQPYENTPLLKAADTVAENESNSCCNPCPLF